MGIREKMNENPKPFIIGTGVVILLGAVLVFWNTRGRSDAMYQSSGKAFFSEDDGATWFAAPYEKLGDPSFKGPKGNDAVLAHVYQYPGEKEFVGYLETYTEAGKEKLAKHYSDPANKGNPPPVVRVESERLVKRPGDTDWTSAAEASSVTILEMKNGVSPSPVFPK